MFERFTSQARHVVVLAQEEARGLQHNYIGTEHLLLGLLGEPGGVAAQALNRCGLTLESAREEVKGIIGIGKATVSGHIPFTPRAKKTLELALREAVRLRHAYIGTEHILLGVIREGDGVAAQIIRGHADLMAVRAGVLDLLPALPPESGRRTSWARRLAHGGFGGQGEPAGPDPQEETTTELRTTPAADTSLDEAARLAGPNPVGSHHLLLAALTDPDTAAARVLASLGIDLGQAREALLRADITGTSDEPPEEAGRRQMVIRVAKDKLTIEVADQAIVGAGRAALDALGDRADPPGTISGALPGSASLGNVWQALRDSLTDIRERAAEPASTPSPVKPEPAEPGSDVA
jgi:ATP-dependent Clp protease ATP-binding subunit ClpA